MDGLAATRTDLIPEPREQARPCPEPVEGKGGTAPGLNIAPGSLDDGWIIPQPVRLPDGSRIQLYKDGEALRAGFEAIEAARKRICLEVYIFRSDPTGRAYADLLARKAREGVAVYVIYDSVGSFDTDPAMFEQMNAAGVRLAEFHPIRPWKCRYSWRPVNRDHRKLLMIDDAIAGLGGLNIGSEYAGSWVVRSADRCQPWRDNAIGIVGPSARLLTIAFARMWRYVQYGGRLRSAELLHNVFEGDIGVLGSVPTRRSPLVALSRLLREAKHSVSMTMSYFAPPDELINELCRAAKRGVRVRLMLPSRSDVRILITAARSFYETLLSAGVEVYERQEVILHAKTLCIDGQTSIVGSTNLDYQSIEINCELSVIIRSAEFGAHIDELFEHDVQHAERITLGEWRRRPVMDRLTQWAVKRARYML